jgi:hypothetical protein
VHGVTEIKDAAAFDAIDADHTAETAQLGRSAAGGTGAKGGGDMTDRHLIELVQRMKSEAFERDEDYQRFSGMVERAAAEIRQEQHARPKPPREVAQSTWDAVLWVLREHGMYRLYDPWAIERLAQFSPEQVEELVAALKRLKTKPLGRLVTDELIEGVERLRGRHDVV